MFLGDCLEVMDELIAKGVKVDAIITDPPYGTTACKWDSVIPFAPMWERLGKLIKPNGAIVLFGSEPFSSALRMSNIKQYKYDWVWDKKTGLGFLDSKHRPLKQHENVICFSFGGCSNGSSPRMSYNPQGLVETDKKNSNSKSNILNSEPTLRKQLDTTHTNYPKSIITYARETGLHPTQKPVALLEYLIRTYTHPGELVLDFTAGSGTTGVACINTQRDYILIEKEQKYYDIIHNRLADAWVKRVGL